MVKSKLRATDINYNENHDIDDEDIDYSAPSYDPYKLHDQIIDFVLGKQKHTYSRYEIVYFPIYLVLDNAIIEKIGIYELESSELINMIDDDGDVKIKPGNMLFFISKERLVDLLNVHKKSRPEKDEYEKIEQSVDLSMDPDVVDLTKEQDDEGDILTLKLPTDKISNAVVESQKVLEEGIFIDDPSAKELPLLSEESKEESMKLKKDYTESRSNEWIAKFMKNNNYDIVDNEGGGDCFFAVIRDSFAKIGKTTTVAKLRAALAQEASDDMYQQYRMLYVNAFAEIQENNKLIAETKKNLTLIKKRTDKGLNKTEEEVLLQQGEELVKSYKQASAAKKDAEEFIEEFIYMKDIDSLEKFREYILKSSYWADTWAVTTIERILNIKVIILSEESFKSGDLDSVLNCGQLNDEDTQKGSQFTPDYYIMTCYTGNHYKLITYKEKGILKFRELPYDIKILIITKCLERNSGPYYLIKDVRDLKTRLGLAANEGAPEEREDEYLNSELYDKDTVFSFYESSNGKKKAGDGSGETIPASKKLKYNRLNSIKDWRKKLDDSWMVPFSIDGHRWNSVEHYFLGSQFKKGFPDFFLQFSIDSNSEISKSIELARSAGSKKMKAKDAALRDEKITIDPDFYTLRTNPTYEEERKKALIAKFSQNLDLKQLLLETLHAKLVNFERAKGHIPDMLLMSLRKELRK
jgi:predicted NAD-dependent protein-ADP-ribosyltransferase YbiA (DUF1768 family)